MRTRVCRFLWVAGLAGLVAGAAWAVDVDAALDAAKKPKKDADKAEVAESAKASQADMNKRIDGMEAERKRKRDELVDKFIDRSALSGGASGGDTTQGSGNYKVYKDKGRAADWAWYRQEVVLQCVGGRQNGDMPSVYLNKSGRWEGGNRRHATLHEAATAACGG